MSSVGVTRYNELDERLIGSQRKLKGFSLTAGLWRPDWGRSSTDLGFGGWGNIPRGSTHRLGTSPSSGSDTVTNGAGNIGLGVEENKDTLTLLARDPHSAALVFSDSATYFLAWPEDLSEGLSPLLLKRLNRIADRCCDVDLSKISRNFLNFRILSKQGRHTFDEDWKPLQQK